MQAQIHFTSSSRWSSEMAHLGVAVLGVAVLGTAVLGAAVGAHVATLNIGYAVRSVVPHAW